jgi:hypothetical protein
MWMVKRPLVILPIVMVSSALGGAALAWLQFEAQLHAVGAAAASAESVRETEAKHCATRLAAAVRAADEVVFVLGYGSSAREVRMRDRNWLNRFSTAISGTTCRPTATRLCVSDLRIQFSRGGRLVFELMLLDNILRVLDADQVHDYLISPESAVALSALVPAATCYIR